MQEAVEKEFKARTGSSQELGELGSSAEEAGAETKGPPKTPKKALLQNLENGLRMTQSLLDTYTKLLARILKGETAAIDAFEQKFAEVVRECPATEGVFHKVGFEDGKFREDTDWENMSQWLIQERDHIQQSVDELKQVPTPKRRGGRPFGSKNKVKVQVIEEQGEVEDFVEQPPAKKRRKAPKRKAEPVREEEEDKEEVGEEAGGEPPPGGEQDEAEDEKGNKTNSIPLMRKCEIVEHAKALLETNQTQNLEKEMAIQYPKELATSGKHGFKSGLVGRWIRTASPFFKFP